MTGTIGVFNIRDGTGRGLSCATFQEDKADKDDIPNKRQHVHLRNWRGKRQKLRI